MDEDNSYIKINNVFIKEINDVDDFQIAEEAYKSFVSWKYRRFFNDEGQSAAMKIKFSGRKGFFRKKNYSKESFTYQDGNDLIIKIEEIEPCQILTKAS